MPQSLKRTINRQLMIGGHKSRLLSKPRETVVMPKESAESKSTRRPEDSVKKLSPSGRLRERQPRRSADKSGKLPKPREKRSVSPVRPSGRLRRSSVKRKKKSAYRSVTISSVSSRS